MIFLDDLKKIIYYFVLALCTHMIASTDFYSICITCALFDGQNIRFEKAILWRTRIYAVYIINAFNQCHSILFMCFALVTAYQMFFNGSVND